MTKHDKELERKLPPGVQDVMKFPAPVVQSSAAEQFLWDHLYDQHFTMLPALIKSMSRSDITGARALVKYIIARGEFCSMIDFCLSAEITEAEDETVVARESTIYTLMLTEAMRAVSGQWIERVKPTYNAFLKHASQKTRAALIRSLTDTETIPRELRYTWTSARKHYASRWGTNQAANGVVATAFLRFICVALIKPFEYGLVDQMQTLDTMTAANELSSIVQAFATGKTFNKYSGQYPTFLEIADSRELVVQFTKDCAKKFPRLDYTPVYTASEVLPLLRWWSSQRPDKEFLQRWGRKMRRITDWRDSHKLWELGSDEQAWMNWSGFRGMITPELLDGVEKRLAKSRNTSALRRGLSGKLKRGAPVTPVVASPVDVTDAIQTLQDSHEFIVVVFYRGFWCFFCEKWMKQWAKQLEHVRRFGGCIVGVTSQDQQTAEDTRKLWHIPFPLYGDPNNVMAKRVFNDIETKRCNETAVYPRGMGQPSVFAYTKDGVLLHSWTQRAHPRNNEGASDRENPDMSAKIACTVFARTKNLIPRSESLDSADWSSIQDSSSEFSVSDTMTDFESTLAECANEDACQVLATKLQQDPKFASLLYNMTGRKKMQEIRSASRVEKKKL